MSQNEYVFGIHAVLALLKNKPQKIMAIYLAREKIDSNLKEILNLARSFSISVHNVNKQKLDALVPHVVHQNIIAQVQVSEVLNKTYDIDELLDNNQEPHFLLILDGIQDPHNLGAILRTANALGVEAVIAPKDKAVGITPAVRKVASGAAETTPFIQVTNLARTMRNLQERGIWLYGATENAATSIEEVKFTGSIALVLGAEGHGLRRLTEEHCDFLVSIPMSGTVSSLNVSVAAGIFIFEAARQRRVSFDSSS